MCLIFQGTLIRSYCPEIEERRAEDKTGESQYLSYITEERTYGDGLVNINKTFSNVDGFTHVMKTSKRCTGVRRK